MSLSEFNKQDYEVIERDYADLKEAARKRCANAKELEMVQKAFDFANEAHKGVRRRSGEPYILHPIAVAKIVVSKIGLGYKSICAALLHDVVEDTNYTVEDIKNLFGDKIASLVDGLTKMKTVLDNEDKADKKSIQAENFKRILLTLNDDIRVVLIKLADRLHNCRTIEFMPEHKRDKILSETMFIFIPLAHRLGLYEVKSEMEDIWLRFKEPEAFNDITAKINRNINDKEKEIEFFIAPIRKSLTDAGFNFEIKQRVKSPYSIWKKMVNKGITFEQVYDLYAVRIIFEPNMSEDERAQCYHIFTIITSIYKYNESRVRDWVKHPKTNGYEALHCTLMSKTGIWIEVQIRTKRMDDIAEKGIAAHWAYKREGYMNESESQMDKWIQKVQEILVNPDVNALELLDVIHKDLTASDIWVYTPKGDQRSIMKGATALDFAYSIHTHIGHKAIAAKVNFRLVPLSYVLRSGDQVEIITAEDERPKREWLEFVKTRKARNVITDYLKTERNESTKIGRKLLEEQLGNIGLEMDTRYIHRLMNHYGIFDEGEDQLYFRIGAGIIKLNNLEEILKKPKKSKTSFLSWFLKSNDKKNEDLIINDTSDTSHNFVIAPCCKPIMGDNVVGFMEKDGTVTVHKKTCSVANSLAAKYGDKIVMPQWKVSENHAFPIRLSIKGLDRIGIINDISRYISFVMSANIRRLNLETKDGIFDGYIDLYIHDKEHLERLINKLKRIEGVKSVIRIDL